MNIRKIIFLIFFLIFFYCLDLNLWAQNPSDWALKLPDNFASMAHHGNITGIVHVSDNNFITSGDDGFIVMWDIAKKEAVLHFQVSAHGIVSLRAHPLKNEIAVLESDNIMFYRLSVWNYKIQKKVFSVDLANSTGHFDYSPRGDSIIISDTDGALILINADDGTMAASLDLEMPVDFALLSISGRKIMLYSASQGILSYWDVEKQIEAARLQIVKNIKNPFVFGNYRFFGGFDGNAMIIIDAVNGKTITHNADVKNGFISVPNIESDTITVISSVPSASATFKALDLTLTTQGKLEVKNKFEDEFKSNSQKNIFDIAVYKDVIVFINEDGRGAFIPSDYNSITDGSVISFFNANGYNRVNVNNKRSNKNNDEEFEFLLWQSDTSRTTDKKNPLLKYYSKSTVTKDVLLPNAKNDYAIKAASINENKVLLLDVGGSISCLDTITGKKIFSYKASFPYDAAFNPLSSDEILIAHNGGGSGQPLLQVNTKTGETLPITHDGTMVLAIYNSPHGSSSYCTTLTIDGSKKKTEIIAVNFKEPQDSAVIVSFEGEESNLIIADDGNKNIAFVKDGEGTIFSNDGRKQDIERTPAFPKRLSFVKNTLIILDNDGSICWIDKNNGRLLAILRFFHEQWLLSAYNGSTKSGA